MDGAFKGHMIRVTLFNSSAAVESQARLNDTKWHLLNLEFANDEVRIGVDDHNSFAAVLSDDIPEGDLATPPKSSISPYCQDRCIENYCQNGAQCVEDFTADAAVCRCKNPNVQSGQNCEIDINRNSSVSFYGGFLKYELSHNPLIEQTVFSFRTDQPQALLMFVHDHNNNFMQLHLSEEVNLTLSLNNEDVVHSCTVRARPGTEYGNMQWTQSSTLTVDDDACTIHAPRKLAEHPIQKFSHVFTDIVFIPVGLNSPTDPKPFVYTFVGGIERDIPSNDGSMILRPIYQCAVPDLLGCLRGLRIGEVIDLRHTEHGYRPNDPKLVRSGCELGCSSLDCKNSGHCSVAWQENADVTCDCSRTSYTGTDCTEGDFYQSDRIIILRQPLIYSAITDNGFTIYATAYFTFDIDRFLSRYILTPAKTTQTLQFAFAPLSPSTHHQHLATIYFKDERLLEVILNRNGSINVGIISDEKRDVVRTFVGNYSDGYRHFLVARFGAHQATTVTVSLCTHLGREG
ncbi:unnamed protein product [Cylicostephanus goldi]|uniref:EGF-like domain-containing protein n=1 Tax=Cylicostephanus goldi TaxID=71465 RepID=A0A3P7PPC2_CYLGO|nr:unnamed protein product [Cylicostephanus goldi]